MSPSFSIGIPVTKNKCPHLSLSLLFLLLILQYTTYTGRMHTKAPFRDNGEWNLIHARHFYDAWTFAMKASSIMYDTNILFVAKLPPPTVLSVTFISFLQ